MVNQVEFHPRLVQQEMLDTGWVAGGVLLACGIIGFWVNHRSRSQAHERSDVHLGYCKKTGEDVDRHGDIGVVLHPDGSRVTSRDACSARTSVRSMASRCKPMPPWDLAMRSRRLGVAEIQWFGTDAYGQEMSRVSCVASPFYASIRAFLFGKYEGAGVLQCQRVRPQT